MHPSRIIPKSVQIIVRLIHDRFLHLVVKVKMCVVFEWDHVIALYL